MHAHTHTCAWTHIHTETVCSSSYTSKGIDGSTIIDQVDYSSIYMINSLLIHVAEWGFYSFPLYIPFLEASLV